MGLQMTFKSEKNKHLDSNPKPALRGASPWNAQIFDTSRVSPVRTQTLVSGLLRSVEHFWIRALPYACGLWSLFTTPCAVSLLLAIQCMCLRASLVTSYQTHEHSHSWFQISSNLPSPQHLPYPCLKIQLHETSPAYFSLHYYFTFSYDNFILSVESALRFYVITYITQNLATNNAAAGQRF